MKKLLCLASVLLIIVCFAGCGEKYTCKSCDETTSKAYYDIEGRIEYVLCEDCAREYWMPFDYKTYRVK